MTVAAEPMRVALRIALLIVVATLLVAVVTLVGFRAGAREWLRFDFHEPPATWAEAGSIWLHNARLALAPLAAAIAVNSPWLLAVGATRAGPLGRSWLAARLLCDLVLLGAVVANLIVVGASIGAHDVRLLLVVAPHGPLELAAFSLALTVYLLARRGPLRPALAVRLGAYALLLLAAGALVEVHL